jgi:hypothetical protein
MYQPAPPPRTSQWDLYAEQIRKQLPAAPEGVLGAYMRWAPWVAMILGALGFIGLLVVGGIFSFLSPFLLLGGAQGVSAGFDAFVGIVVGLVLAALEVVGGYLMRKGSLTGWWILAIGIALSLLNNLFRISIFSFLITLLIAYVHLQVKPRYQ